MMLGVFSVFLHISTPYKSDDDTRVTIWLFNIAMERSTIFNYGKPSISMGHLFSMAMLVITRGFFPHFLDGLMPPDRTMAL